MRQKHALPLVIVALGTCLAACGSPGTEPAQEGSSGAAGGGFAGTNVGPGGNPNSGYGGAGNRAGAGGASAGSGGLAALGGQSSAGAGGQPLNPACVKPAGNDVAAQDYSLPNGCSFHPGYLAQSSTVASETQFLSTFSCDTGASSGIDFSTQRLRVAIYPGSSTATRTWAVETAQEIEVGLSSSPWCGGTAPPSYFTLVLLPVGSKAIVQSLCSGSCNFGAGGFPA